MPVVARNSYFYFSPALLPGLKELSDVSPIGAPSTRMLLANIVHLGAAAAVLATAWGLGRMLILLALRSGRSTVGIEAPLLQLTTASALGLGTLSLLTLSLSFIGLLRPKLLWVVIVTGVVAAALDALCYALRQPLTRPPIF